MKKLIVSLMTAFLMATGLAAFAGTAPANAACPYTGCVNTTIQIKKLPYDKFPNNRLYQATIVAGNTHPKGKVRFTLFKGGKPQGKTLKAATKAAPVAKFNTGTQKKGTYTLQVCYTKQPGSIWKSVCQNRVFTFKHNG